MARKGPKSNDTVAEPQASEPQESTETNEEQPLDLSGFESAVATAIKNRDESNGDLRQEDQDAVVAEFRTLDGQKPRNKAKSHVEDGMKAAIQKLDVTLAKAYVTLKDALTAAAPKKERSAADPTEAFVQAAYHLGLAATLQRETVPEGVKEDWEQRLSDFTDAHAEEVETYRTWVANGSEGDKPEVHAAVRQAFNLAAKRVGKGGKRANAGGPRRNVKNHIAQVFAEVEEGTTLTVNQISKASSKEYGTDHPSAGAVTQALFPKNGKGNGINGIKVTTGKPRGATKVAA